MACVHATLRQDVLILYLTSLNFESTAHMPHDARPWDHVPLSRLLHRMGHAQKHVPDFQHLEPTLKAEDIARLLEYVRQQAIETGSYQPTRHGGTLYTHMVSLGGKPIRVHVVTSAAGIIKTGFPEQRE